MMKSPVIKIQKVSEKVSPFAAISLINNEFNACGMSELIDTELGSRVKLFGYSYSEILRNMTNIFLAGGDCMEDINTYYGEDLKTIPSNAVPSPDTLLRGMQELKQDNIQVSSTSGKVYNFNTNPKLNKLNIKSLKLTGELVAGNSYDLDYDNQIIAHEKYDAKRTYKKNTGYFPGVCSMGDKIVYIENRDGNANVKTAQSETLQRCFDLLSSEDIEVNRARMDAGSYSEDIIKVVSENSKLFYIRANRCENLYDRILKIDQWEEVEINYIRYQVCSLPFTQFLTDRKYRLVVMREKREEAQLDLFEGAFKYRCILTNDQQSTEKDVIEYYNQRGTSEKLFDVQNNDFGWKHLPFSDMDANTVYLILTAMIKNFYNCIVRKVSLVFDDITPVTRLKRFVFRFVSVSGKWVRHARQWVLKLYTDRPYEKVFC